MAGAQIIGVASFLPERVVKNDDTPGVSPFFRGVLERRFASPDYTSVDLGARALGRLLRETGTRAASIDLLIASSMLTDSVGTGIAGGVAHAAGLDNASILNVDTNCTSWISALGVARAFIESGQRKSVAIVTATNFVSRIGDAYRSSPTSYPLGDGASATLLVSGEPGVLAVREVACGENTGLLSVEPEPIEGEVRRYWEAGAGPLRVSFTSETVDVLMANALKLVPRVVRECLDSCGMTANDVSLLVTHQPNAFFLEEWRRRIGIEAPRVHDTLSWCGNLFQGSIPVTLADACATGKLRRGDIVAVGAFANAGDVASSAVIRW
jgi:3-oxoacyl-[acyl-carrier-protein] synthase III